MFKAHQRVFPTLSFLWLALLRGVPAAANRIPAAQGHPGPHNCWGAEELRQRACKAGVAGSIYITSIIFCQARLTGPADPREQGLTLVSPHPALQDHEGAGEAASLPRRHSLMAGRRSGQAWSKGSHGAQPSPAALLLPASRKPAFQHRHPPR